ncbi:MAG: T9SS type A sorting domain-containing protein [Candidatus Latescibacteria bacterium]|nr:T9SS type A sorting domain-containing protein [Candidatus Latescibacterota bacterium]
MRNSTKIMFVLLAIIVTFAFAKTDIKTDIPVMSTSVAKNNVMVIEEGRPEIEANFTPYALPEGLKIPNRSSASDDGEWYTYTRWDSMSHMFSGLAQYYGLRYRTYDFNINSSLTFENIEAYWVFLGTDVDSTIRFQIYAEDGTTLLWESPDIILDPDSVYGAAYLDYDINPDTTLDVGETFFVVVKSQTAGIPRIVGESNLGATVTPRRRNMVGGSPGAWGLYSISPALSIKVSEATTDNYAFDIFEGFDGATFPPTGWSATSLVGTYNWVKMTNGRGFGYAFLNTYLNGDNTGLTPTPPPGMAAFESYNANQGDEARLATPAIATSATDYKKLNLRFYAFRSTIYSTFNDTLFIETSTDGGTNWTPVGFVTRYSTTIGWTGFLVDCGIFPANSNVNIGFRAKGAYGDNIYIDQVMAWQEDVTTNDVGVIAIDIPAPRPIWVGDTREITVTLKNFGLLEQTSFDVTYDPGDGSTPVTETWTGTLASTATTDFTFDADWNCNTQGSLFAFKAWTELATDQDKSNDTAMVGVAVCPIAGHIPPFSKDFNEGWGPYGDNPPFCGWTIVDYGDEAVPTWNGNDWFKASLGGHVGAAITWNPIENSNDWLITPRLDCSADGFYTLSFWHTFYSWGAYDSAEVYYTTDDGLIWNLIAGFYGDGATVGIIDQGDKTYDVTSLVAGEDNVKFAFVYRAYDSNYWIVDDFLLDYLTPHTLTVTATNGSVTKNPDLTLYPYGSTVELTAAPDSGYAFVGWSGDLTGMTNPENILMDGNKSVTANFAVMGWNPSVAMPTNDPPKYVKDGGALVAVPGLTDDGGVLYAFKGWKSGEFKMFDGAAWTDKEPIPFGLKPGTEKIAKKYPGKGASLCWDGANTIYATKGNGTREFWAYDMTANTWTALEYVSVPKALKGGSSIAYHDGKVYLLAGAQKVTEHVFYVYDVTTNTWATLSQTGLTNTYNKKWADGSALTYMNGMLYALKGKDKENFLFAYDMTAETWTQKATLPLMYPTTIVEKPKKTKVGDGGSMTNDGSIFYAIKGGGKDDFWSYNPGADEWTGLEPVARYGATPKKSVPKTGAGLAYLDGYVYLLKGNKTDELLYYIHGSTFDKVMPSTIATTAADITNTSIFNFTATTFSKTINYSIPASGKVSLKLYNATGRLVETIHNGYTNAGSYSTTLPKLANGVYFLKYNDGANSADVKIIVQ